MAQQHIAAIRDVPLVGHGQDGNTWLGHDVKLGKVSAKVIVTVITSTDSEGLVRLLVENDKWLAAFRD